MECTLMHKNIPVVVMEINSGFIAKLKEVHDERHLPVGVRMFTNGIDRKRFNDWWLGRSIPTRRIGMKNALEVLGVRVLGLAFPTSIGSAPKVWA